MSKFSGKCDFYDVIGIHGFEYIRKSKVYIGHDYDLENHRVIPGEEVHIDSIKDCVPYYPYVVSVSACNEDAGVFYLMEKSWVDIEEERYGHRRMHDYYREALQEEIKKHEDE